jgi:lipid-binding SYLF domain-containing protein
MARAAFPLFVFIATAGLPWSTSLAQEATATPRVVELQAVRLLERQMSEIPTKRIPLYLRRTARCIAIFPGVIKAGLIIAAQRGQGFVSCRKKDTDPWGPPAYYNFTAASVGLQAGIQEASIVMLALTKPGVEAFMNENVGFEGNVSVAAGPVGGSGTLTSMPAVATYARTQGLFAGVDLGGANISFAKKANASVYGPAATAQSIVYGTEIPENLKALHAALVEFAPRSGETRSDEED